MSGLVLGTLTSPPPEARKRSPTSIGPQWSGNRSSPEKNPLSPLKDRVSRCRFSFLKLLLGVITLFAFVTFIYSPAAPGPQGFFVPAFSRRAAPIPDTRYASSVEVNLGDMFAVLGGSRAGSGYRGVGLLNFKGSEAESWRGMDPGAKVVALRLDPVPETLTWETLYPEWIDEGGEGEAPVCPSLPAVQPPRSHLDLVAVKLPCRDGPNWARDVARLHLQLATARLAASAKTAPGGRLRVLIISKCLPIPNLFTCKEMVAGGGDGYFWLYEPNLPLLRERLRLPIGSCQLSIRGEVAAAGENEQGGGGERGREAYVTVLHSTNFYVCGAIVAAQSIRMAGSTRELVILLDGSITADNRRGLEAAGWKVRPIERIRNPRAERDAYNEWNYSKLRLWQLTEYTKLVFVDADLLVLRPLDRLFRLPEVSAVGNNGSLFNSGVMVVEPADCTFRLLSSLVGEVDSYNGGDQGYLNEIFPWWHRVPKTMNFLKHSWAGEGEDGRRDKARLFAAVGPAGLHVVHYLGLKPWLCFRDYDCNWNVDLLREFASDEAHRRWWQVHDAMPEGLQRYCLLRSKQKAALEWDRRGAEAAGSADGHWRTEVRDPRLKVCIDDFCRWETMLDHWGENATTGGGALAPLPVL